MAEPRSISLPEVPTAVMKRRSRESSLDSFTENPSRKKPHHSASDPHGSDYGSPSTDHLCLCFPAQSTPLESISPIRAQDPLGDTFVPETVEDDGHPLDWADGDGAAKDYVRWRGWIVPDTYDGYEGYEESGPLLSGVTPVEKEVDEEATEEKAVEESVPEPWEDAGYIRWENAMHAMLGRMKKRSSVNSDPKS